MGRRQLLGRIRVTLTQHFEKLAMGRHRHRPRLHLETLLLAENRCQPALHLRSKRQPGIEKSLVMGGADDGFVQIKIEAIQFLGRAGRRLGINQFLDGVRIRRGPATSRQPGREPLESRPKRDDFFEVSVGEGTHPTPTASGKFDEPLAFQLQKCLSNRPPTDAKLPGKGRFRKRLAARDFASDNALSQASDQCVGQRGSKKWGQRLGRHRMRPRGGRPTVNS